MKLNPISWNRFSTRAGRNGKSLIISGVLKSRKTDRFTFILLRIVLSRGLSSVTLGTCISKTSGTLLVIVTIKSCGTVTGSDIGLSWKRNGQELSSFKPIKPEFVMTGTPPILRTSTRSVTLLTHGYTFLNILKNVHSHSLFKGAYGAVASRW
jgi:hypothetical protein